MSDKCPICDKKYNEFTRKKVVCDNQECMEHNSICLKCFKDSVLKREDKNWNCVFCNKEFTLYESFQKAPMKAFLTQSIELKFNKKLEEEKISLAKYQSLAKLDLLEKKILEEQKARKYKIIELEDKINILKTQTLTEKIGISREKIRLKSQLQKTQGDGKGIIYNCPSEDCNGFLNENMVCEMCHTEICKFCNKIIEGAHGCNEEDIQTVELLKKITKPCPDCNVAIQKIDGCDQMWCTRCRTTFSWNTGNKQTGVYTHNPHYNQYLREMGENIARAPQDNECLDIFEFTDYRMWVTRIQNKFPDYTEERKDILSILNVFWCLRTKLNIHIEKYFNENHYDEKTSINIRFLNGDIDEKFWKSKQRQLIKKSISYEEQYKLWKTFLFIIEEQIRNLIFIIEKDTNSSNLKEVLIAFMGNQVCLLNNIKIFNEESVKIADQLTQRNIKLNITTNIRHGRYTFNFSK